MITKFRDEGIRPLLIYFEVCPKIVGTMNFQEGATTSLFIQKNAMGNPSLPNVFFFLAMKQLLS